MAIRRPFQLQQVAPILDDGADGQPLSGDANGLNVHAVAGNVVIGQVKITNGTINAGVIDLATRDALAVGIVDGNGDQITSFGGGVQHATNDPYTDTDVGTLSLAVRQDVQSDFGADGDFVPLSIDANGALRVAGGGGGTEYAVDDALGATPTGKLALAIRDDALSALTPVEGDAIGLRVGSTGALWTAISGTVTVDGSGVTQPVSGTVTIQDGGNVITVDGTVAVTNAGLTELAAAINASSQMDVNIAAGSVTANAGTNLNTSALLTTAAHDAAFGTAGTADAQVRTVQGIASMTPLLVTGAGDIAHDSADSGNPIKMGAKAYSPDGTTPGTAVAEADRTHLKTDLDGLLYVSPATPQAFHYHDDDAAAVTTDGTLKADPGDGFAVFITNISFSIGAATASTLFIEEGSTKIWGPHNLPATIGAGFNIVLDPPLRCTASTAVLITNTGSIVFAIDVDGFVAAV
jgi:hypothetical protein